MEKRFIKLQETVSKQTRELKSSYEAFRALEERSIDLEARCKRNNLLFFGLKEEKDEDCRKIVEGLLNVECGMKKPVVVERVHRVGSKRPGSSRPMIVKFLDYNDKMRVKKLRDRLPDSVYVKDDLPWAVREAQRSLLEECKKARQQDRDAFIAFPARLIIDGQEACSVRPSLDGQQTRNGRQEVRGQHSRSNLQADEVSQTDRNEACQADRNEASQTDRRGVSQTNHNEDRNAGHHTDSSYPDNSQYNAWQTATRGRWRGRGRGRRGTRRDGYHR